MAGKKDRGRAKKRVVEKPRRGKPKVCVFCSERIPWVDYKDTNLLRRLMTDRGKIKARRVSGTCTQHQRDVAAAIKTAREMALLPYVLRPTSDKTAGRNGRGAGRGGGRSFRTDMAAAASAPAAPGADQPPGSEALVPPEGLDAEGMEPDVDGAPAPLTNP